MSESEAAFHVPRLTEVLDRLAHEIREARKVSAAQLKWFEQSGGLTVEQLNKKLEELKNFLQTRLDQIMAKLEDVILAATALSTASDSVSLKLDNLITKVDAALASLQNADLTPEQEAALAAVKASRDTAVAAGDKVDAEVAKLDGVLPTPAPGGSPN